MFGRVDDAVEKWRSAHGSGGVTKQEHATGLIINGFVIGISGGGITFDIQYFVSTDELQLQQYIYYSVGSLIVTRLR